MSDFDGNLIEQIRAGGGKLTDGPFAGRQVLILTTTGAQSKEQREAPLVYGPGRATAWWSFLDRRYTLMVEYRDVMVAPTPGGADRSDGASTANTPSRQGDKQQEWLPLAPSNLHEQLHRVRGEDRRSGDPSDRPASRRGIGRSLTLRSADGR